MRGRRILTLSLSLALFAGCGSDGKPMAPITAEDAPGIAGIAIEMIGFSTELAYLLQDYWFLIEKEVPSGNYPCEGGGSFTATVEDRTPTGELSAGDRVVLQFFDCAPDSGDPGFRINGSFSYRVESADIALPSEEYVIRYTLDDLELEVGGLTFVYVGGLLATHWTDDQILFRTEVEIDSLRWTLDVPGVDVFEQEISNATLYDEWDDTDGDWMARIEGDFYDSGVGGVMDLETILDFRGEDEDPPDEGILEIRGANNSLIRLTALGGDAVRLETDEDGDGTFESTVDTTWDDISPG
jgi:hypothetical protein